MVQNHLKSNWFPRKFISLLSYKEYKSNSSLQGLLDTMRSGTAKGGFPIQRQYFFYFPFFLIPPWICLWNTCSTHHSNDGSQLTELWKPTERIQRAALPWEAPKCIRDATVGFWASPPPRQELWEGQPHLSDAEIPSQWSSLRKTITSNPFPSNASYHSVLHPLPACSSCISLLLGVEQPVWK